MRTTVDISGDLLKEAMRVTQVRTKTTAIVMGLQELINKAKLDSLRALRGKVDFTIDTRQTRRR